MAERTQAQLQTEINTEITANGNQEITGPDLNTILTDFNDTLFSNSIVRIVSITRADLMDARDNSQLIRGRFYFVTDSVVPLIMYAVGVNLLRKWSQGVASTNYNEIIEYDIDGDVIIWQGQPMRTVQLTVASDGQLAYTEHKLDDRTIDTVQFENMMLTPSQYTYNSSGSFTLVIHAGDVTAGMFLLITYH